MRGTFRNAHWCRYVLSLVLLAANVGAPFSTTGLGRTILQRLRPHAATCALVRVRGTTPLGVNLGFRAVVGLSKGGPDGPVSGPKAAAASALIPAPADTLPSPHLALRLARPTPPLRC